MCKITLDIIYVLLVAIWKGVNVVFDKIKKRSYVMKEMTKKDQALIKRAERNLNKMVSFEVWSNNLKYSSDIQEIVKASGLTPKAILQVLQP